MQRDRTPEKSFANHFTAPYNRNKTFLIEQVPSQSNRFSHVKFGVAQANKRKIFTNQFILWLRFVEKENSETTKSNSVYMQI